MPRFIFNIMINWRSGLPTDFSKKYLVSDGKDISTSTISTRKDYETGEIKFREWVGDDNTYEHNECCSGTPCFDLTVCYWCPIDELNLPNGA